ncbi:raffinose/stachyose/melibiose transport system permease protein [Kribbella sp. VKM Ac-2527]|uniref:Raffinose/stachyose/melibiose transport system permease protein n=1 Tax=Kribbella caucasensis TaxID=2512215 RepID=A0A4R6KEI8_9ACTN|nr:sugar ABC transporter permease [Kribbella sp. VKM Ac-2527]TDO47128.1 raffinose/stachyose/melibiose transport system permease protein [Kribbella sp. VKM Ac-2527]
MRSVAVPATRVEVVETEGKARRAGRRAGGSIAVWWWAVPAVVLTIGIQYLSVAAGSVYAFTNYRGFGKATFVGFDNFVKIFHSPATTRALWNTLLLAACFVIFTNVIGMALALALNRLLKLRYFLRVLIFLPVVLSPLAVAYVWKFIFQPNGPLNGMLRTVGLGDWATAWLGNPATAFSTIAVVVVWQNIGLAMVIYLAGLANVSPELEEAGAVDGAGPAARLFRIVLPLLRPTIVIASTLTLIQGLRVFDQVQALTAGGPYGATETLSTLVYKETFVNGKFGYGSALSLLLTVLIIAAALLQNAALRSRGD